MSNKKKAVIYPIDAQIMPILRHSGLLSEYEIIGLVSPNGWGFCGKDASYADSGGNVGLLVENNFDKMMEACDTVIFVEPSTPYDFKELIFPKIKKGIESGKNIICAISIEQNAYSYFMNLSRCNHVEFKTIDEEPEMYKRLTQIEDNEIIYDINTPVIFVLGTGDKSSKFEIQLSLRESFLENGYKVSQIGSRKYCEMIGFHSFPQFMFADGLNETKKIIMFNRLVKKVERDEKPDVIIIGIPGGIMPVNRFLTNKFGITAYEVSRAVLPDCAIFSTIFEDYASEYFDMIFTSVRYKLGFEIDCFNLANQKIDWYELVQDKTNLSFLSLDGSLIDEKKVKYQALNTPVYNIFNVNDRSKMFDYVLNALEKNALLQSL